MNKQWLRPDVLLAIVVIPLAIACSSQQALTQKGYLRYDEFIKQVETGEVTKVILNSDRTQARVKTNNGEYRVNLPNDPGLMEILTKAKGLDIVVEPSGDKDLTQERYLSYNEFIKQVKNGEVTKVILNSDRTQAKVQTRSGWYRVNLPNDPNLLEILTAKDVDIAVEPSGDKELTPERSLSYDKFIKQVKNGEVTKVILNSDRTQARAQTQSGRYRVNLPNDPNLLEILTAKDVDIAIDSSLESN
ncbi:MAG: hypothetical protein KME17_29385 [Cyanosarcina radialis HA8281-LM2]|nr:hypothetical protein [Cyanosarcina radialis HA8281-LM2]